MRSTLQCFESLSFMRLTLPITHVWKLRSRERCDSPQVTQRVRNKEFSAFSATIVTFHPGPLVAGEGPLLQIRGKTSRAWAFKWGL